MGMREAEAAFQFDDLDQQRETAGLGMWTFLVTEVMFFGGLFGAYIIYRMAYPEAFAAASHHLYMWIGAINTGILLGSSLTMAMAVHAAAHAHRRQLVGYLAGTAGLGAVFLVLKGVEYALDIHDRIVPGVNFHAEAFAAFPDRAEMFFVIYFIMTGLHALHVTIGVGVIVVLALMAKRGWFSARNHNAVEMTGLYWHFVDIVWIFLFPLLYLIT